MKKLFSYISITAFIIIICVSANLFTSFADVGDFNDYGGGGDWGGGGGWDSDSDWGGSGELDAVSGTLIALFVIAFVVIFILGNKQEKKRRTSAGTGTGAVRDHTDEIVAAVLSIDPNFSNDKFIAWVKEVFFTLNYAWMERDWAKVRPFEKEELYKQHEMQIQQYINSGRINVLERINVNQAYLQRYVRDNEYEYLTVFLQVRMTDYIKDEKTGQILKGSPDVDSHMKYLYTFMRKTGVLTSLATSNKSTTNCPYCGAPTNITSAGKCEYCDNVVTTGVFDWVLSNIDGVKPQTVIDDSGVIIRDNREDK